MSVSKAATNIRQIGTVAIPVADQERAIAFYVGALGFEKRRDVPFGDGGRWIEVAPPGSEATIALPPQGEVPVGVDTGIRLTTADSQADHQALTDAGAEVSEILRYPGVPPMFSFHDPDGNTLYVVES